MSSRIVCLLAVMALGLGACQKTEEVPPAPVAETPGAAVVTLDAGSSPVVEMQSAALEAQDATAALNDAASAAVGMANEAGKK